MKEQEIKTSEVQDLASVLAELQANTADTRRLALLASKDALTADEVSELYGIGKYYLYRLTMEKKIPFYKPNGRKKMYFSKQEIESWLLSNRVTTEQEIEQKALAYCATND